MIFGYIDKSKEVLEKYTELWNEIKNQIETINVADQLSIKEISWKLGLNQMMIYI